MANVLRSITTSKKKKKLGTPSRTSSSSGAEPSEPILTKSNSSLRFIVPSHTVRDLETAMDHIERYHPNFDGNTLLLLFLLF